MTPSQGRTLVVGLTFTTDTDIDISGRFMTGNDDDDTSRRKYELAEGAVIPANGYRVFYELQEGIRQHISMADGCRWRRTFIAADRLGTIRLQSGGLAGT